MNARGLRCALLALALMPVVAPAAERGVLANRELNEISGLARSLRDPTVLWAHNDSGDGPVLYRVGDHGEDLGRVTVPAARAIDWEDIAAFDSAAGPALLVADTGDNYALRNSVTLYAVRDPGRGNDVALLWRLEFRFPEGPRDCEAVAVDSKRREILLISKRDWPRRLYRLPLPAHSPRAPLTAEFLGTVPTLPGGSRERPTALDISRDGRRAVVLTLRHAYLYRAAPAGWAAAFAAPSVVLTLPLLPQAEAAAFDPPARHLTIASEGRPPRYAVLDLPP